MAPNTGVRSSTGGDDSVVGSIDAAGSPEGADTYVIADISTDGAWLSMPAAEAPTLVRWR